MNIRSQVYNNLTAKQRVIASIEAEARGDEQERLRLIKSCPKQAFQQNESAYTGAMEALMTLALVVECDLRGEALFFFSSKQEQHLQNIVNIHAAWMSFLDENGIKPEAIEKAFGNENAVLKSLLADCSLEPTLIGTEQYRLAMESYLAGSVA